MTETCNQCGGTFDSVKVHWGCSSTCDFPPYSETQREILEALSRGGKGSITKKTNHHRNPSYSIETTRKGFLEWLSSEFPILGSDVKEGSKTDGTQAWTVTLSAHPELSYYKHSHTQVKPFSAYQIAILIGKSGSFHYSSDSGDRSESNRARLKIAFPEDHIDNIHRSFKQSGYEPTKSDTELGFSAADTADILSHVFRYEGEIWSQHWRRTYDNE